MVHKIKLKKRIWSLLLCLCMVLSCLPVSVFAESGTTTVAEAKWGTSKDNLTGSGTLAEAVATAKNDSTIKYIRLNKSWTATGTGKTYYEIEGTGITIDLNGKTVSGPLALRANSGSVTFTDSVGGGKWENTAGGSAVIVDRATATFTGGSYKGEDAVYVNAKSAVAVIEGGTFTSGGVYAVSNSEGKLTVKGGVFAGEYGVCSGSSSQSTTITGGDFSQCSDNTIIYFGGTVDLSVYPTTTVTGTTPITELTVFNWTDGAITVGTDVKLPEGYGFYKTSDTAQTIVTTLAADSDYAIKSNGIPVAEAKWGTDKNNLTGSGTLAEAVATAKNDSTIKYIRLNKSWTATGTGTTYYEIEGTGITIDLNGKTVSGPLALRANSGSVTFTDSVGGGKWENTCSDAGVAVRVDNAEVTFIGGLYKGSSPVSLNRSGSIVVIEDGTFESTGNYAVSMTSANAKLTIEGGSFTGGSWASVAANGTTTIKGGSFTAGAMGHIAYWSGTLDLSGYPTTTTTGTTPLTDLTISNRTGAAVTVGTAIKLPGDYSFYKSDDTNKVTVTELAAKTTYAIKTADIISVDITWTSMEFTYTDGAWNPETHDYNVGTWSTSGGTVTVKNSGSVTVTASFDYVSATDVTGIDGRFTKQSFDLAENASDTTTLTLSGQPSKSLENVQIGSITVTIAQKNE